MKSIQFYLFGMGLFLLPLFLLTASIGYAQETPTVTVMPVEMVETAVSTTAVSTPSPLLTITTAIINKNVADLTFADLGIQTIDLMEPAAASFSFDLPYRWRVREIDSYIDLFFDVQRAASVTDEAVSLETAVSDDSVTFTILIDERPIASFIPEMGLNQQIRLPIPRNLFANPDKTNHQITFLLHGNDCTNTAQTRLNIQNDSNIHLEYNKRPLKISLADFPRPLIQEQIAQESILILIPDAYSDADLSAAASVAAALGQAATRPVTLTLTTTTAVSPEQLMGQSIIAIGSPAENSFIAALYQQEVLPTTVDATGALRDADGQPVLAHVGILQELPSETDPDYAYLIVTGSNDEAIARAARALSTTGVDFGQLGNLALVDNTQENENSITPPLTDELILADLGFINTAWSGLGHYRRSVYFTIPEQWRVQDEAAITFSYLASSALDTVLSSLQLELNGQLIGQVPLSAAQTGETEITIPLPVADMRYGDSNRLTFVADMAIAQECPPPNTPQAWLRIRNDGIISLPYEERLPDYEKTAVPPFAPNLTMSDLLFALPEFPAQTELNSLVQLAQIWGKMSLGNSFAPVVQRMPAADVETAVFAPYQVVAIGRPSDNALIAAVNSDLPQPFLPDSDNLGETVGNLQYRLPKAFSLGIIQYLPAPWEATQPLVLVSGTTEEGVRWATDALTGDTLNGGFADSIIFVQDTVIEPFTLFTVEPFSELITSLDVRPDQIERATVTPTVAAAMGIDAGTPTPTAVFTLNDNYAPPDTTSSTLNTLVLAAIGSGLLLLIGGALYTWRKS